MREEAALGATSLQRSLWELPQCYVWGPLGKAVQMAAFLPSRGMTWPGKEKCTKQLQNPPPGLGSSALPQTGQDGHLLLLPQSVARPRLNPELRSTQVWPPGYFECERRVEGSHDIPYDVSLLHLCRGAQLRGLWIQEAMNKGFLMQPTESDLDVER